MKILFLLILSREYSIGILPSKSGLTNSARFVVEAINKFEDVFAEIDFCKDQNQVEEKIKLHTPDICILEAVWIVPAKFQEIVFNNPTVKFITRVHSKIPFVATEGTVIEWIKEYQKISIVSFNHKQTSKDFNRVGIKNTYLPNIYPDIACEKVQCTPNKYLYKIGCFGSIRPLKNQLNQAVAAIIFAEKRKSVVHFYINGTRIEQRGETVLRNLRALFAGGPHRLIECDWLKHDQFLQLVSQMDACMQVSFTESFNIVAADAVAQNVPIVGSDQIEWLSATKAKANDADDIARCLAYAIDHKDETTEDNIHDLDIYNKHAISVWFRYLKRN